MNAGVIGLVDGSFDAVSSFSTTVERNGHELTRALEVTRVFSQDGGTPAFEGHAVAEAVTTDTEMEVGYGSIETAETERTVQRYTRLAGVPGEFVVVGSGRGTFAFDMVAADTDTDIERADIDLDDFLDARADPTPWKAGFENPGGAAENGVLHGEDLFAEDTVATLVADATLTQLGLEYEHGDADVKMTATASGYLERYDLDADATGDFLAYLAADVLPHLA